MDLSLCPSCARPLPQGPGSCPSCDAPTLDAAADLPQVPGYRMLRALGEGGMGSVFLADEEALGRNVAIKLIKPPQDGSGMSAAEARTRFQREARAMANVEHPNVVRVYAFGETNGQSFLVMEHVNGETLAQRIRRAGPLPVPEAVELIGQVVDGLEAASERGIVHRDVKPSNILLDKKGRPHVADFGLARSSISAADSSLTQSGHLVGTPQYVSPEQARGRKVDFRGDIYSLGLVFYETLTGKRAFGGSTPIEVIDQHLHQPLPPLGAERPDAPAALAALIEWMTRKDPDQRPASYFVLRDALDAIETPPSAAENLARRDQNSQLSWPRLSRSAGRRKALVTAVGVAALVAASFFALRQTAQKPKMEKGLVIVLAHFQTVDADASREARVMEAMAETTILEKLKDQNVRVVRPSDSEHIKSHEDARHVGGLLGASIVVWGNVYSARGEAEIQPNFTLVPPPANGDEDVSARFDRPTARLRRLGLAERQAVQTLIPSAATNQFELRRGTASSIGDSVVALAALNALYLQENPAAALSLLDGLPRTRDLHQVRALALVALKRTREAEATLRDLISLDSSDPQSWASLADLYVSEARWAEAIDTFQHLTALNRSYTSRTGFYTRGALYHVEYGPKQWNDGHFVSRYLLRRNRAGDAIERRFRLPGSPVGFHYTDGVVDISCNTSWREAIEHVTFTEDELSFNPYTDPNDLLLRYRGFKLPAFVAELFAPSTVDGYRADQFRPDLRRLVVEGDLGAAKASLATSASDLATRLNGLARADPTQPVYLFLKALLARSQQTTPIAEADFRALITGPFDPIAWYEWHRMAVWAERFRAYEWADQLAMRGGASLSAQVPGGIGSLGARSGAQWPAIEFFINWPHLRAASLASGRGIRTARTDRLASQYLVDGVPDVFAYFPLSAWTVYLPKHPLDPLFPKLPEMQRRLGAIRRGPRLGYLEASAASELFRAATRASLFAGVISAAWWIAASLLARGVAKSLLHLLPAAFQSVPPANGNGVRAVLVCSLVWMPLGVFVCSVGHWLPSWQLWMLNGCCVAIVVLSARAGLLGPAKRLRRRSLLAVAAIVTTTFCFGLYFAALSEAKSALPIGLVDAPANGSVIASLEELVKKTPSDEARLLAGLCNQQAGRVARAKQLFEELGPSDRKDEVLSTLNSGRPARLELINDELILRASSRAWRRHFWSIVRGTEEFTFDWNLERNWACVFLALLVGAWSLSSGDKARASRLERADARITWATSLAPGLPSFLRGKVGAAVVILFGAAAAGIAAVDAVSGLWPTFLGNSAVLGVFWPPGPALGESAEVYWLGSGMAALPFVKAASAALLGGVALAVTLQVRDSRALLYERKAISGMDGNSRTEVLK
jgi:serine/threonine protein kinase/tetratricopeptide (TPR) repeat protein